eukprot:819801-Alexandrium_andersonii.AAC.1
MIPPGERAGSWKTFPGLSPIGSIASAGEGASPGSRPPEETRSATLCGGRWRRWLASGHGRATSATRNHVLEFWQCRGPRVGEIAHGGGPRAQPVGVR